MKITNLIILIVFMLTLSLTATDNIFAQQHLNIAIGNPGIRPLGDNGKPLNLDFETGTLKDWKLTGDAFKQQPHKGKINPKRLFGAKKKSDFTGKYWIGGYEFLQDTPKGTLSSVPFTVTHRWASFLFNGGSHAETRVEIVAVRKGGAQITRYLTSGKNSESMRPVILDLEKLNIKKGGKIFIRLVDNHTGGWGHLNFDDFRFYKEKPRFKNKALLPQKNLNIHDYYKFNGLKPEAAAKAMKLPEGFSVELAAAEPNVKQPIAMAIDDRGRLWVAEAYEYPRRAPNGKGRDRILIFEDTNQDGKFDKRTVFQEKLNLVSGLEVGFGGVFVGAAPYLMFIPDKNRDDKPDGPPQILLDGWAYQDTHETLNAFIWGPDGWLYGCHGVFTHSKVGKPGTPKNKRIPLNAAIWRYHPLQDKFEIFAEGTSNPWGVDFDDHGQSFCTACVIPHLYHIIQGARYQRQAGNHFNQYTYDDIKTIADHRHFVGRQWNQSDRLHSNEAGGGHAHAGAMIYMGGSWPQKYRGKIFMNNIHGARINMDILKPSGSGFIGSHGQDFIFTSDVSSQIINLRYGPDGQAWMIDWYDRQQCHAHDINIHDRSNGRIYRVVYNKTKPVKVDMKKRSDEQLVKDLLNHNDWYVRHARRLLQERAATGKLSDKVQPALFNMAMTHADVTRQLRGLWALHVTNGLTKQRISQLLNHNQEYVRAWTIQLMMEKHSGNLDKKTSVKFAQMAKSDSSKIVRLYLASALQRVPLGQRWEILANLASHPEDAKDHNLPLMYWYAAEPLAKENMKRALAFGLVSGENISLLNSFMIRRIGSSNAAKALALLVEGLGEAKNPQSQLTFLRGINKTLIGQKNVKPPKAWDHVYKKVVNSNDHSVKLEAWALATRFGDSDAIKSLSHIVKNDKLPLPSRRRALRSIVATRDQSVVGLLQSLVAGESLRREALQNLAAFDDSKTPEVILKHYADFDLQQRRSALATLSSRVTFANRLLDEIANKKIPANHLSADIIRQLRNLKNEILVKRIIKVWGPVRDITADKVKLIAKYKKMLSEAHAHDADLQLGRAVFAKTCMQCHTLFGSGQKVGPDLTGSNRANLDYILSNVLDPSAVMAKEYQPLRIETSDGQIIIGIVKQETTKALVVETSDGRKVIAKDEIEEKKLSSKSMMPDDILKDLKEEEVHSLIAYLAGKQQVPMLATKDTAKNFFNGKDLAGWIGDNKLWKVENGEIVGKTGGLKRNEYLFSEMSAENFHLTLEVKLTNNQGNSGIQFRSQRLPQGEVTGYQADIGAGWWGKLYEEHGRALLWNHSGERFVKTGQWNKYEVIANGSHIQTKINGQLCVNLNDPKGAKRGIFALQLHSGGTTEVRYRNLNLKLLSTGDMVRRNDQHQFKAVQLTDVYYSEGANIGDIDQD